MQILILGQNFVYSFVGRDIDPLFAEGTVAKTKHDPWSQPFDF